jgi:YesN/AraC family two-component response regulator
MINSLINTIEEFRLDIEDNEFGLDAYMVNENFEVIDDLRKALKDLSLKICQMVQTQRNSMDEKLADGIIRFINKNFADNTLSSIRIAETFGVSVSHCNKIFKGCTGDTVMEYVDKLRLVKAKELLINSDDKLQDILDKTGYVDKVNFIRKFKKKEGMTPIQYRSVFRRSDTKSNC